MLHLHSCQVRNRALWAGLALVAAVLPTAPLEARQVSVAEPAFTTYGMREGLSQGTIRVLLMDEAGLLWIGTADGLNRFDGVDFRSFKHTRGDTTSLSDDDIRALATGPDGTLWVGTARGGLNHFDPRTGRASRHELGDLGAWLTDVEIESAERRGRTVYGIIPLGDGSLFLSTDVGQARFDPGTATAVLVAPAVRLPSAHLVPHTCALAEGGGLLGLPDGSVHHVTTGLRLDPVARFDAPVTALRCPGPGPGLIGTDNHALYTLDSASAAPQPLLAPADGPPGTIRDALVDGQARLWIATTEGLHVAIDGGPVREVGVSVRGRALPNREVFLLQEDPRGMLWVGTWNGLSALDPRSLTIRRIRNTIGGRGGLEGVGVLSIQSADDGGLWLGTMDGGVQRVEPGWREASRAITRPGALRQWPALRTFGLARGAAGALWVANLHRDLGILYIEAGGARARKVPILGPDGVEKPFLGYSVLVDHTGAVWAGTYPTGLVRYDPSAGAFRAFRGPEDNWDFGSTEVPALMEDSRGRLWVGAMNGGVSVIDADRRTHHRYVAGPSGLSTDRVLALFSCSRGYVWIGTEGGGLNRLDPETGEIKVYTMAEGLPHDHVEAIIEDDAGYLWLSTNDGIARFNAFTDEFWVLKEAMGLAGDRFYARAVHKNERGELFFGGEDGLTVLDPELLRVRPNPPPVALTGFRILGREASLERVLAPGGLDLEPDENFFTFEFAALDFADPTQNRYRYRLEGLNQEWIDAGPLRTANYTSVPPGRYTFRVAARNADGVWNEQGLAIPVLVQTPYYQTWWFQSLVAVAVLLLISGFYSYRLHEVHRRQALRLGIAGRLHDDIGSNLSAIALKSATVRRAGGLDEKRLRQLAEVGDLARETALKVRETVWAVNTRYDSVSGLMSKMRNSADMMLGGNVSFEFRGPEPQSIDDRAVRMELRQDVYLLYKEALHNALKHSGASSVRIAVTYDAPQFTFRVSDDGEGFDPKAESDGSGLGLMKERANKHGGVFTIESGQGRGTTVELRIRMR